MILKAIISFKIFRTSDDVVIVNTTVFFFKNKKSSELYYELGQICKGVDEYNESDT